MMAVQIACTILATFFFGILFRLRRFHLIFAAVGGGVGWLVYLLVFGATGSKIFAFFLASTSLGIYAEIVAAFLKTPATGFIVCAIIPLVPGSGIYYTMYQSIQENIGTALSTGLETLLIAGAIASGIALSSSVKKIALFIFRWSLNRKDSPGRGPS